MSRSSWATCPNCLYIARTKATQIAEKARKSYGKVSAEKYEANMAAARRLNQTELEQTLREDWDIGVDEHAIFEVIYSCSCQKCRYRFTFRHSQSAANENKRTER